MYGGAYYGIEIVDNNSFDDCIEHQRYTDYSTSEQQNFIEKNLPKLTLEQREIYNLFSSRVSNSQTVIVFLDAPGGTGKSFLINLILAHVRSQQKIAIAAASSGITATILNGGQTLHSTFKVPLDVHMHDMPTCAIKNCFLWQIS